VANIRGIQWVPVGTARRILGVSRQRVYELIAAGKLSSYVLDGVILVSQESIQARVDAMQRRLFDAGDSR
jgi:hypothetical protein